MADQTLTTRDLMNTYDLSEDYCTKEISNVHASDVCLLLHGCSKWQLMVPILGMKEDEVSDTKHALLSEDERRQNFILKWRKKHGCEATFKALINALIKIECHEDAEEVCKFLKESIAEPSQQTCQPQHVPPSSSISMSPSVSASHLQAQVISSASTTLLDSYQPLSSSSIFQPPNATSSTYPQLSSVSNTHFAMSKSAESTTSPNMTSKKSSFVCTLLSTLSGK
jgi:hypothetical protein